MVRPQPETSKNGFPNLKIWGGMDTPQKTRKSGAGDVPMATCGRLPAVLVLVLVGRIESRDLFTPTFACILQNKDELRIPLDLEQIPTPKAFRDAIESLSPEQQRFAKAIRAMQLESTLFGICVIQIKPQLEKLLRLPCDSLTKETQLTQDLMELFIKYQVNPPTPKQIKNTRHHKNTDTCSCKFRPQQRGGLRSALFCNFAIVLNLSQFSRNWLLLVQCCVALFPSGSTNWITMSTCPSEILAPRKIAGKSRENRVPPRPQGAALLPEWLRMVLCLFKRGPQVSPLQEAALNIAMDLEHEPVFHNWI